MLWLEMLNRWLFPLKLQVLCVLESTWEEPSECQAYHCHLQWTWEAFNPMHYLGLRLTSSKMSLTCGSNLALCTVSSSCFPLSPVSREISKLLLLILYLNTPWNSCAFLFWFSHPDSPYLITVLLMKNVCDKNKSVNFTVHLSWCLQGGEYE